MPMKFVLVSVVVSIVGAFSIVSGAGAATQPLALMSTQGEVQLACRGEQCAATFSSYCLLNERPTPAAGTAYRLASADGIRVTGRDRRGVEVNLDPARVLEMTTLRMQVAVRISIAKSHLAELGLSQVSVVVGEQVTLLPVPEAGDENPLSEAEIALATGPLRQAGRSIIDEAAGRGATVRWLAALGNSLPVDLGEETLVREQVVQDAIAGPAMAAMSKEAQGLARGVVAGCNLDLKLQIYPSLRRCVESAHDAHLWNLNADYWQAVNTGS